MIHVYHYPATLGSKILLGLYRDESLKAVVREHFGSYTLVAEVATNELNIAYSATNTITDAWWANPNLVFKGSPEYADKGCRSTSVGDVLSRTVNGKEEAWIVAPTGYIRLEADQPKSVVRFGED